MANDRSAGKDDFWIVPMPGGGGKMTLGIRRSGWRRLLRHHATATGTHLLRKQWWGSRPQTPCRGAVGGLPSSQPAEEVSRAVRMAEPARGCLK